MVSRRLNRVGEVREQNIIQTEGAARRYMAGSRARPAQHSLAAIDIG
jgi:hypothetical protein